MSFSTKSLLHQRRNDCPPFPTRGTYIENELNKKTEHDAQWNEPAFETHFIEWIQTSVIDNNQIVKHFALGGVRITTVVASFSDTTAVVIPTS